MEEGPGFHFREAEFVGSAASVALDSDLYWSFANASPVRNRAAFRAGMHSIVLRIVCQIFGHWIHLDYEFHQYDVRERTFDNKISQIFVNPS